ncbi:MAG: glyoxalase [Mucilaginibacter sp.]|nr:glyoxalase [Mucilaginibacter sp.]
MKPTRIWANLGVKDVDTTRSFYTSLGFKSNEGRNKAKELTSFLIGNDDFVVHFFAIDSFKDSTKGEVADLTRGNEVMFTLWAESKQEVDTWAVEVRNAGGMIFTEPSEFGERYYGFGFSDPDGHKWNVFHM